MPRLSNMIATKLWVCWEQAYQPEKVLEYSITIKVLLYTSDRGFKPRTMCPIVLGQDTQVDTVLSKNGFKKFISPVHDLHVQEILFLKFNRYLFQVIRHIRKFTCIFLRRTLLTTTFNQALILFDCFKGGSTDFLCNACLMNTFWTDLESNMNFLNPFFERTVSTCEKDNQIPALFAMVMFLLGFKNATSE
jgi:hypothetical protein